MSELFFEEVVEQLTVYSTLKQIEASTMESEALETAESSESSTTTRTITRTITRKLTKEEKEARRLERQRQRVENQRRKAERDAAQDRVLCLFVL